MTKERISDIAIERDATAKYVGADVLAVLDSIDIPIVVVARDRKVTSFNRAAAEVLGVAPSDLGRRPCSIQALADVPELEQVCIQVMADGVPSRHDLRNGDRWFLVRISPYTGADRQISGAVLAFTNVTAFRASLGQAIYEREYTKTILNTVIDPLVVLGEGLQVQTANRAFYDWFGTSRQETHAAALSDMGDDEWRASGLWSSLKETFSHNREFQTIEFEGTFPKVGRRTVLLDARRLARDGTALVLLAFRDITERKQAEQARRESETRFRTLFESMDEGYCVVEMIFDDENNPIDYRFLEVNPVFEKQTGIKGARGRLMREIAPDHEQHWFDNYGRIALTGETLRFENPAAALRRYFEVCAFRVGAPELRHVGIVFNDVTERKNLDRQRELALAQEEALRKDAETATRALAQSQEALHKRVAELAASDRHQGIQDDFMRDKGIDYFENTRRATHVQRQYAMDNPLQFKGYGQRCWGITASDGPGPDTVKIDGIERQFFNYIARGVPFGPDDGTIAPWAVVASLPFAPDIVLPSIEYFVHELDLKASNPYGFKATFNATYPAASGNPGGWVSPSHYGLNQGPIVLMIENYRSELLWQLTRRSPYIVSGLRRAGFKGGWLRDS